MENLRSGRRNLESLFLLFDLGGVLVRWDGIDSLLELTEGRLTRDQARRFWLESDSVRLFETGRCSPEEFTTRAVSELGLNMTPRSFLTEFVSWDRGPLDGAVELLQSLRGRYPLGCLTNNNPLHWPRLRDEFGFSRFFDYFFVSHEIGLIKPDLPIFEYVLREVALPPDQILFFDDNPECVEAAETMGMRGCRVQGVEEVKAVLAQL